MFNIFKLVSFFFFFNVFDGVRLAEMAFYFLNVAVPCCVWMQIHTGGKQPRMAGTCILDFGLSLVVSVIFQLVILSLCTLGRVS